MDRLAWVGIEETFWGGERGCHAEKDETVRAILLKRLCSSTVKTLEPG